MAKATDAGAVPLALKATPSFMYNNLTANDDSVVYAHNGEDSAEVHVVRLNASPSELSRLPYQEPHAVTQVKFVRLEAEWALVVASTAGFQLWDAAGTQMLYFFSLSSVVSVEGEGEAQLFVRGVAATHDNQLVVGTSQGDVLVFDAALDGGTSLERTMRVHRGAVCDVHASRQHVASADDTGAIVLWGADDLERVCTFPARGPSPCVAVRVRDGCVVGGFSSGHVRMYSAASRRAAIEVCAHSRAVTAVELHPHLPQVATAAADMTVNVWALPDFDSKATADTELLFSCDVPNGLLTGVAFLTGSADKLVACSYDSTVLTVWARAGRG